MGAVTTTRVRLAALLPLVPVVLALAVQPVPHRELVTVLDGPWHVVTDDGHAHDFTVPGRFGTGNIMHGVTSKRFSVDDVSRDLFLMVPNIRGGFAKVSVNGTLVGEKGVPGARFGLDVSRLDGFSVPASLLRAGDNELSLELFYPTPGNGFPDDRFFLGPPEIVKTYLERATSMKALLEYGAMMVSIFGFALIAYLYTRGRGVQDRALYRSSLLVMAVVVVYLAG